MLQSCNFAMCQADSGGQPPSQGMHMGFKELLVEAGPPKPLRSLPGMTILNCSPGQAVPVSVAAWAPRVGCVVCSACLWLISCLLAACRPTTHSLPLRKA